MLTFNKNQNGFTVMELLISIGIFGIVVPSLASGINNLIIINNRARDLALTHLIAENKLEQLRNAGYNSLTSGTVSFSSELPNELSPPRSASYTVVYPEAGVAEISVNIDYKDYNQTRNLQYKTVISELGVGQ